MINSSLLDTISKVIATVLLPIGGFLVYFAAKKIVEKAVDSRFDERLEKLKHDLQLQQQKMSVVYQHQKDSFRNVLVAMHGAIEAIGYWDYQWIPAKKADVQKFSRVLHEEALFLDSDSDRALQLFREIMWTGTQDDDDYPDSDIVGKAYNQMLFISERLAEYFRVRVGLEVTNEDPLFDVVMLGACHALNSHRHLLGFPAENPFTNNENKGAAQLVAAAKANPELLKSELLKLREALIQKRSAYYFERLMKVDNYLARVSKLAGPPV